MISGADAVVETLKKAGVDVLFGIPSIHNIRLYEALRKKTALRHILCRHETTAVHAADGYARASRGPGLVLTSTGPGAAYAAPALLEALGSCSPVVMITTNIPSRKIGMRLGSLHELQDQHLVFKNITKAVLCAGPGDDLGELTEYALNTALEGRPGPVYLEVPTDLLEKPVSNGILRDAVRGSDAQPDGDLSTALSIIRGSKTPLILAGTGAVRAGMGDEIASLAETLAAPVTTTCSAKGIIPEDNALCFGNIGRKRIAGDIADSFDTVIAVGTRLREVDGKRRGLALSRLIHIDWDDTWFNRNFDGEVCIAGNVPAIIRKLIDNMGDVSGREPRRSWIREYRANLEHELNDIKKAEKEMRYIEAVRKALSRNGVLVTDNTQLGYWAEYFYPSYVPGGLIPAKGSGIIGFSFPAAMGAKLAGPHTQVVSLIGDGGFLYCAQELATCMRHGIGFPVVVVNDNSYGIISYLQKRAYGSSYESGLTNPDFSALARSHGAKAERVDSPEGMAQALEKALASGGMWVIELAEQFPGAVFERH